MKAKNILTLFAGGLLFTACSSENIWDYDGSQSAGEDQFVDVTFTVAPESLSSATRGLTRAEGDNNPGGPGQWQSLSRGSEIDMLVYAVYDEDHTLLSQYGEGLKAAEGQEAFTSSTPAMAMKDADGNDLQHKGQTIVNVGSILADGESYTVTLRLMRKKAYTIAFWAQSSKTQAYNTDDLRHVEVIYDNAINNDETRDAFCKAESFTVTEGGLNQNVILTRPLAQINVGTTGADYKNLEIGTYVGSTHKRVAYSKVIIKNVSKYFDIVANKVLSDADIDGATEETSPYYGLSKPAATDVVFNWAKIPAYYKTDIPQSNLYQTINDEELLKIDLNRDGEILPYKTSYPTLGSQGSYMTEAFKYLSMSYVLVAPALYQEDQDLDDWITSSKVIDSVTVFFAEAANGGVNEDSAFQSLNVSQVPAYSNWRTNILGGLKWMQDPTDPKPDPEDPNFPGDPDNPYDDPDYPDNPDDPNNPYDPEPPTGPDDTTIFDSKYLKPVVVSNFDNDIIYDTVWTENDLQNKKQ
ncbi:MAG: hypothetical protein J1D77_05500 [Muribaculaceae bacterium]|nr:hypothetical protein [Muribaculaceae bacterium]